MECLIVQQQWMSQLRLQLHSSSDPSSTLAAVLAADFHTMGAPCLPNDIAHRNILQGCFVLQVDEIVNIAAPARDRCVGNPAPSVAFLAHTQPLLYNK